MNEAGKEFGDDHLCRALQQVRRLTPEEICRFVIGQIRDRQGNLPQHDDITLIVAKIS